jgi:hypothetical protein
MKAYQKIMMTGLVLASMAGLYGCANKTEDEPKKVEPKPVTIRAPQSESGTGYQSGIALALGDINGDGLQDLVVGSPSSVRYFKNIGNGKFSEEQIVCSPQSESGTGYQSGIGVALGDIDNDKDLDLIVGSPSSVRAYLNQGGKFSPQVE